MWVGGVLQIWYGEWQEDGRENKRRLREGQKRGREKQNIKSIAVNPETREIRIQILPPMW